jgi:hypothetical protein
MWPAITAIFTALAAWLEIRRVGAAYELSRKIESDIANDEDQILRFRAAGGTANQLAADQLQDRLLHARGILADLPAPGPPPPGGSAGGDGGGRLHAGL